MSRILLSFSLIAFVFAGPAFGANKFAETDDSGAVDIGKAATWSGAFPTASDNTYYCKSSASLGYTNRFYLSGTSSVETNALVSGTGYVCDNSNVGWAGISQHITLDLLQGASYTGSLYLNNSYDGSFSALRVRDAGTIWKADSLSATQGRSKVTFENGATVTLSSLNVGTSYASAVTNELVVDGATLNVGTANFCVYANGYNAGSRRKALLDGGAKVHFGQIGLYDTEMIVSNASVAIDETKGDNDVGNLTINRGATLTLAGGSVTGGQWTVGARRGYDQFTSPLPLTPAKLRITGGHHGAKFLRLGAGEGMTGIVEMDGEDAVLEFGANFYGHIGSAAGCTGIVTVAKGTMTVRPNTSQTLRLAPGDGAYGELNVKGGLFDYLQDCESGIWMDVGGNSKINVSGGELRTQIIRILPKAGYRADVVQSGGLIDLRNYAWAQTSQNHFELTGGEFRAPRIAAVGSQTDVTFLGNGGAIVVNGTTSSAECGSKAWFENFTSVTFGANGLSFDTAGYASTMKNAFADATDQSGLFVKKGLGTLTVDGSYAVAKTRIESGTLTLASASVPFATALAVVDGGIFSLVGTPATATLSGLAVTNGVLRLDPTDVLTVSGPVSLENPSVELSSLPEKDAPCNLLVVTGELDAETQTAWRRAVSLNFVDGQHISFSFSYDAGTGKTTMTATLKDDAPRTVQTTWTGSGAWETEANWSDGVPAATNIADFSGTPASREVTVGNSATAGALAFADGDYALTGGTITMDGEKGQVRIDAELGSTNVIASAIRTWAPILSETAGAVALNGMITGGGFEMKGSGRMTLGSTNAFTHPVVQSAGVLEVAAAGALTTKSDIRHRSNAVKFSAADTVTGPYRQLPTASTTLMTINNAEDVTFTDWRAEGGRFLKRGAGTMTVKFSSGCVMPVFSTAGSAKSAQFRFPEDGSLPYYYSNNVKTYYDTLGGLSVAEGNLVWTSDTPGLAVTTTGGKVFVGFNSPDGTAEAKFTIKDIDVTFSNDPLLELGQQSYRGAFSTQPTFELINSTTVFNTICVGDWCYGQDSHPTVSLTNSWLSGGSQVKLSQGNGYANSKTESERAYVYWRAKDSRVTAGVNCYGFTWFGGLKLDFDHSTMNRKDGVCDKLTGMGQYSYGYMNFTNDSLFAIKSLSALGLTHDCKFRFAGSTWKVDDDLVISSANVTPQYFKVESYAEGLRADVSSGKTFTFADVALTGDGGLTSVGAGTVAFSNGMCRVTGPICADAGVIDLTDAGTLTNATLVAGAGTIKGGTFHNATLLLDSSAYEPFNFADCTFTGKTEVRIAGEPATAENLTIANFTGALTGVDTFKLKGWKGLRAAFEAKDGVLAATIGRGGAVLILH